MNEYNSNICPLCKTEIKEDDTVKICQSCGISHHQQCWDENKGCALGCSEQVKPQKLLEFQEYPEQQVPEEIQTIQAIKVQDRQITDTIDICIKCGAEFGDGQEFCAKCGTPRKSILKCGKCGALLEENLEFCPKCGYSLNCYDKRKKKRNKIISIAAAVVLLLCGISSFIIYNTIQANNREEAIAAYKKNAYDFCTAALTSGSDMEKIGNEIQSYWGKYVGGLHYYNGYSMSSIDDAVAAAQKEQESNIQTVKNAASTIQSLYNSLLTIPDIENQELQEIKTTVKELYDAYQNMYDCVIDVSGNYTTFKSKFGDTDSEFSRKFSSLNSLLRN